MTYGICATVMKMQDRGRAGRGALFMGGPLYSLGELDDPTTRWRKLVTLYQGRQLVTVLQGAAHTFLKIGFIVLLDEKS